MPRLSDGLLNHADIALSFCLSQSFAKIMKQAQAGRVVKPLLEQFANHVALRTSATAFLTKLREVHSVTRSSRGSSTR